MIVLCDETDGLNACLSLCSIYACDSISECFSSSRSSSEISIVPRDRSKIVKPSIHQDTCDGKGDEHKEEWKEDIKPAGTIGLFAFLLALLGFCRAFWGNSALLFSRFRVLVFF